MLLKHWAVAPQASPSHLHRYKVSPVLAQILYNRGFEDPKDAHRFLYTKDLAQDPYNMKDMEKAVNRIWSAIEQGEAIVVYGDFDADGVTSTTLMMQVLKALNANVSAYIPHRIDEGYGLNKPALEQLAKNGTKLIVTVDCGIRSVNEVEAGISAGLDIIITDHHSIGPEIPPALAVVNPQQEDCAGEERLAGVGVAFMVAKALLQKKWREQRATYPSIRQSDLLDLVAIGTVADIMPLNCIENRAMIIHGLQTINESRRKGIRSLMEVAGLKAGAVSAMDIGFGLGPRINAAGRLDDAIIAFKLLSARDDSTAKQYAQKLQQLNTERQQLTRDAQSVIREQLEDMDDTPLIFAGNESFQPGIVGLVAGRLAEEYYRPTVIMELGGDEVRASCRSIPEFNITQALDECADLLVRHGGHAMAAGFTVQKDNIPQLEERLMDKAQRALEGQDLVKTIDVDVEMNIHRLSEKLVNELQLLEPTGHGNSKPTFITKRARVIQCRTVGNDDRHLKLRFARAGKPPIDAIGFGLGHWATEMSDYMDVVYSLEMNEWNGRRNLQMRLKDVRPSEVEV